MEIIKLRYQLMHKSLITFQKSLEMLDVSNERDQELRKLMCDGAIQRFEYCIDGFWKYLKLYLEKVRKVSIELSSPREVLRLALHNIVLTDDEYSTLIVAISDRNLTSHTYNEELAKEIQQRLPSYYLAMKNVVNKLAIDTGK